MANNKTDTTPDEMGHALKIVQLEGERDDARNARNFAQSFMRNVATELEDGADPLKMADDIREALDEGRPNGTNSED